MTLQEIMPVPAHGVHYQAFDADRRKLVAMRAAFLGDFEFQAGHVHKALCAEKVDSEARAQVMQAISAAQPNSQPPDNLLTEEDVFKGYIGAQYGSDQDSVQRFLNALRPHLQDDHPLKAYKIPVLPAVEGIGRANEMERETAKRALLYLKKNDLFVILPEILYHDPRIASHFFLEARVSGNQNFIAAARRHLRGCFTSSRGYAYSPEQADQAVAEYDALIKDAVSRVLNKSDRLIALEETGKMSGEDDLPPDMRPCQKAIDAEMVQFIGEGVGGVHHPNFAEREAARQKIAERVL